MALPLLLDLTHTSHTRARTGVQRVARALRTALGQKAAAVCFDPYKTAWRPLESFEIRNLDASDPSAGRASRWPLTARLRGRLWRLRRRADPLGALPPASASAPSGALFPEIFSAEVGAALPALFAAVDGPRVAIFHDAIALQYPEQSPRSTVARFPGYLRELLRFDGVAAVSEVSRETLLDYWGWLGVAGTPEVATIGLGLDPPPPGASEAPPPACPTVLCVGSIEGRKNQASLLEACESLWAGGAQFQLRLIGLANAETGAAALQGIERLRALGRPVRYDGAQDDRALEAAYRECAFTVYPSLAEGFGLPVAESVARGKPCICGTGGALGEIARGGGCLGLATASADEIASAMGRLLASPGELFALAAACGRRRFKTWDVYADELLRWMRSLKRNA